MAKTKQTNGCEIGNVSNLRQDQRDLLEKIVNDKGDCIFASYGEEIKELKYGDFLIFAWWKEVGFKPEMAVFRLLQIREGQGTFGTNLLVADLQVEGAYSSKTLRCLKSRRSILMTLRLFTILMMPSRLTMPIRTLDIPSMELRKWDSLSQVVNFKNIVLWLKLSRLLIVRPIRNISRSMIMDSLIFQT